MGLLPERSLGAAVVQVQERAVPTYDAGGRLSQVEVYVRGDSTATEIVSSSTTNTRGQREQIV